MKRILTSIEAKPITGYPGYYATSSGQIITTRTNPPRILKARLHKGYLQVNVKTGIGKNTSKTKRVHQLIAIAYYGNKQEGMLARHLNDIPLDNRAENIAWGTTMDNHIDSIKNGTAVCLRLGEEHPRCKLTDDDIVVIKQLLKEGMKQKDIAHIYNISQRHVSAIKLGQSRYPRGGKILGNGKFVDRVPARSFFCQKSA